MNILNIRIVFDRRGETKNNPKKLESNISDFDIMLRRTVKLQNYYRLKIYRIFQFYNLDII